MILFKKSLFFGGAFLFSTLFLFSSCRTTSSQLLVVPTFARVSSSTITMSRAIHQVRLIVAGKNYLFQGVFLIRERAFFLLAHQGPMKIFAALASQGRLGVKFYLPPMKRALPPQDLLADLEAIYLLKCSNSPSKVEKRHSCRVGKITLRETFEGNELRERLVVGPRGERRILFKEYKVFGGKLLPSRILLKTKSHQLNINVVAFQENIPVKKTLFTKIGLEEFLER